jgi:hypothetical protein
MEGMPKLDLYMSITKFRGDIGYSLLQSDNSNVNTIDGDEIEGGVWEDRMHPISETKEYQYRSKSHSRERNAS